MYGGSGEDKMGGYRGQPDRMVPVAGKLDESGINGFEGYTENINHT